MPRFFIDASQMLENSIVIRGDDFRHLVGSLRTKPGDTVTLCDGCGTDYDAKLCEIGESKARLEILSKARSVAEPSVSVTLFQGLSKGERMEYAFQKAAELGASVCVPLLCSRCIAKVNDNKLRRLSVIVREAAMQSGRGLIPEIREPTSFDGFLKQADRFDLTLIPYEEEHAVSIKTVLQQNRSAKTIAVAIGPEGGFSPEEIKVAIAAGAVPVTLGNRILRTETAPVTVNL